MALNDWYTAVLTTDERIGNSLSQPDTNLQLGVVVSIPAVAFALARPNKRAFPRLRAGRDGNEEPSQRLAVLIDRLLLPLTAILFAPDRGRALCLRDGPFRVDAARAATAIVLYRRLVRDLVTRRRAARLQLPGPACGAARLRPATGNPAQDRDAGPCRMPIVQRESRSLRAFLQQPDRITACQQRFL